MVAYKRMPHQSLGRHIHAPHETRRRRRSWRAQRAGKKLALPPAASLTTRDPRRAPPQPLTARRATYARPSKCQVATATAATATAAAAPPLQLLPPLPLPLMAN